MADKKKKIKELSDVILLDEDTNVSKQTPAPKEIKDVELTDVELLPEENQPAPQTRSWENNPQPSIAAEAPPKGVSQRMYPGGTPIKYKETLAEPVDKTTGQKTLESHAVLASDMLESAKNGSHPELNDNLNNVPVNSPESYVYKLSDPHGDPQLTGDYYKKRIAQIEEEKKQAGANLRPGENFADVNTRYDQKIKTLQDAAAHTLKLQNAWKELSSNKTLGVDLKDKIDNLNATEEEELQNADPLQKPTIKVKYDLQRRELVQNQKYDAAKIGMQMAVQMGDKDAEKDLAKYNAGLKIADDRKVAYEYAGYDALQTGSQLAESSGNKEAATELASHSSDIQKRVEKNNPKYFRKVWGNQLGDYVYKNEDNPLYGFIFTKEKLTPEEVQVLGKKAGLKQYQIDQLTPEDVPTASSIYGQAAQSFVNTVNPFLDPNSKGAKFFTGDVPEAQKRPDNWKGIAGEIASGAGMVGGFMLQSGVVGKALKGTQLLGDVVKGAKTYETAAQMVPLAVANYNSAYNTSKELIGDDPEDAGKRGVYTIAMGTIATALMSIDPVTKIGQDAMGPSVTKGFLSTLKKYSAEEIAANPELIKPGIKQTVERIAEASGVTAAHMGSQAFIMGTNKIADNIAAMIADPNHRHGVMDGVGEAALSASISMVLPSIMAGRATYKANTPLNREIAFGVGHNSGQYLKQISTDLAEGKITNEDAQTAHEAVLQMKSAVRRTPEINDEDQPLTENQRKQYAFNLFQEQGLQNKLKSLEGNATANNVEVDKAQVAPLQKKISELEKQRNDIYKNAGTDAEVKPIVAKPKSEPTPEGSVAPEAKSENETPQPKKEEEKLAGIEEKVIPLTPDESLTNKTTENDQNKNQNGRQSDPSNEESGQSTEVRQAADSEGRNEPEKDRELKKDAEAPEEKPVGKQPSPSAPVAEEKPKPAGRKKFVFKSEEPEVKQAELKLAEPTSPEGAIPVSEKENKNAEPKSKEDIVQEFNRKVDAGEEPFNLEHIEVPLPKNLAVAEVKPSEVKPEKPTSEPTPKRSVAPEAKLEEPTPATKEKNEPEKVTPPEEQKGIPDVTKSAIHTSKGTFIKEPGLKPGDRIMFTRNGKTIYGKVESQVKRSPLNKDLVGSFRIKEDSNRHQMNYAEYNAKSDFVNKHFEPTNFEEDVLFHMLGGHRFRMGTEDKPGIENHLSTPKNTKENADARKKWLAPADSGNSVYDKDLKRNVNVARADTFSGFEERDMEGQVGELLSTYRNQSEVLDRLYQIAKERVEAENPPQEQEMHVFEIVDHEGNVDEIEIAYNDPHFQDVWDAITGVPKEDIPTWIDEQGNPYWNAGEGIHREIEAARLKAQESELIANIVDKHTSESGEINYTALAQELHDNSDKFSPETQKLIDKIELWGTDNEISEVVEDLLNKAKEYENKQGDDNGNVARAGGEISPEGVAELQPEEPGGEAAKPKPEPTEAIKRKQDQLKKLQEEQDDIRLQKEELEAHLESEYAKSRLDAEKIDELERQISDLGSEVESRDPAIQLKKKEIEALAKYKKGADYLHKKADDIRKKEQGNTYSSFIPVTGKTAAAIMDFVADQYERLGNVHIAAIRAYAWAKEKFKGEKGIGKLTEDHIKDLISPYVEPLSSEPIIRSAEHLATAKEMLEAIRSGEISIEDARNDIMESEGLQDKTKASLLNYLDWHTTGKDYYTSITMREPENRDNYYDDYPMTGTGERTSYLSEQTLKDVTGQDVLERETAERMAVDNIVTDAINIVGLAKNKHGEEIGQWANGLLGDIKSSDDQDPVKKITALTGLAWELRAEKTRNPESAPRIDKILYQVEHEWKETLRGASKTLNAARANRLFRNEHYADMFAQQIMNDAQRRMAAKFQETLFSDKAMLEMSNEYDKNGVLRDRKQVAEEEAQKAKNQEREAKQDTEPKKKKVTEKIRDVFRKKKAERESKPDEYYSKKLEGVQKEIGKPDEFFAKLKDKIKKNPC